MLGVETDLGRAIQLPVACKHHRFSYRFETSRRILPSWLASCAPFFSLIAHHEFLLTFVGVLEHHCLAFVPIDTHSPSAALVDRHCC